MDPRQHDMGGHVADDMGIVSDVGRAWIGCPSIGFDGCALSQVPNYSETEWVSQADLLQYKSASH